MLNRIPLPPGLSIRVLFGTPRRHREDLIQEAYLAVLSGRNPSTVARNYLAREMLHELREKTFSQLPPNVRDTMTKRPPGRGLRRTAR